MEVSYQKSKVRTKNGSSLPEIDVLYHKQKFCTKKEVPYQKKKLSTQVMYQIRGSGGGNPNLVSRQFLTRQFLTTTFSHGKFSERQFLTRQYLTRQFLTRQFLTTTISDPTTSHYDIIPRRHPSQTTISQPSVSHSDIVSLRQYLTRHILTPSVSHSDIISLRQYLTRHILTPSGSHLDIISLRQYLTRQICFHRVTLIFATLAFAHHINPSLSNFTHHKKALFHSFNFRECANLLPFIYVQAKCVEVKGARIRE